MKVTNKFSVFSITLVAAGVLAVFPAACKDNNVSVDKIDMTEEVRNVLMENPEIIIDSLNKYREDQERATAQKQTEAISEYLPFFNSGTLPEAGNPEGDVTIVEFYDYNCGYCKKAFPDVAKIIESDENVKVVFAEMPIFGDKSERLSRLALASDMQGKFFEFHAALMNYTGPKNDDAITELAEKVGLDTDKLFIDADSKEVKELLAKSLDIARSMGLTGTPAFVIGNQLFGGYIGFDRMKTAVESARK